MSRKFLVLVLGGTPHSAFLRYNNNNSWIKCTLGEMQTNSNYSIRVLIEFEWSERMRWTLSQLSTERKQKEELNLWLQSVCFVPFARVFTVKFVSGQTKTPPTFLDCWIDLLTEWLRLAPGIWRVIKDIYCILYIYHGCKRTSSAHFCEPIVATKGRRAY